MKKLLLCTTLILGLTACAGPGDPDRQPLKHTLTSNGYVFDTVLEGDGCTLYRTYSNFRYVYWARCQPGATVTTNSSYKSGKTTQYDSVTTQDNQ